MIHALHVCSNEFQHFYGYLVITKKHSCKCVYDNSQFDTSV